MCYFVSIGARAPAHFLTRLFEGEAELDVDISPVAARFPTGDLVRLVTWRGCSCDLVGPPQASSPLARLQRDKVAAAFRRSVVSVVRELGSVRILVHGHGTVSSQLRQPSITGTSAILTVHEFLSRESWFVEDVMTDISEHESSQLLDRRRTPGRAVA